MYTAQEAYELLEKQVEGREDYVYQSPQVIDEFGDAEAIPDCVYTQPDGGPSCLVGYALHEVLDADQWSEIGAMEYDEEGCFKQAFPVSSLPVVQELFEPKAIRVLSSAQYMQDLGVSWGQALKKAQGELES